MKRFFLSMLFTAVGVSMSFGQIAFKNGDNDASLGIGFGMAGIYGTSNLPPISATFEHAFTDNISGGGLIGYSGSSYDLGDGYSWSYSYLTIAARGAYHYDLLHNPKFDTYGGLMLGYNIVSVSTNVPELEGIDYSAGTSYLSLSAFIGARYYFTPNLNASLELGYGLDLIRIAIGYKL